MTLRLDPAALNLGLASAHRELIQTYAMLRAEAERDPLTDAFNRMFRCALKRADRAMYDAKKKPSAQSVV